MDIGAKLKAARLSASLTQEQVAEALGVSRQTVSNWETAKTYPDIVSVVKLSDLYGISLDRLLKEERAPSGYVEHLEQCTNVVKSRERTSRLILVLSYLVIWSFSLLFYWLLTGPTDAMGYAIVFLWGVLPVSALTCSLLIKKNGWWGRTGWCAVLVFGLASMLADYGTFRLSNMLATDTLRAPSPEMLLLGAIPSALGLGIGALLRRGKKV